MLFWAPPHNFFCLFCGPPAGKRSFSALLYPRGSLVVGYAGAETAKPRFVHAIVAKVGQHLVGVVSVNARAPGNASQL
jgi:hypothetical protein